MSAAELGPDVIQLADINAARKRAADQADAIGHVRHDDPIRRL